MISRQCLLTATFAIVVVTSSGALAAGSSALAASRGTFALSAGQPKIVSELSAVRAPGHLAYAFDIVQQRTGSNVALRDYAIDYDKKMHLVAVSDDFQTFVHLHPTLDADGHFRGTFSLPRAAHYFAYADSTPQGLGQQVFRFPVNIGDAATARPQLGVPSVSSDAGPYRVTISSARLTAGHETILKVHLAKDGRPASDLHGYLGGAAHAVFVDSKTLTYAHVHPTLGPGAAMSGMDMSHSGTMDEGTPISDTGHVPPDYALHVGPQPAGRYKLWLQFRGGNAIYVAPFTIDVR